MGITKVKVSGRLALACGGCGELILSLGASGTGMNLTLTVARGASCAVGAGSSLRSQTAWSKLAPGALVEGRLRDAQRTPQNFDLSRFEEYYAISLARGWLLSASAGAPKGAAPSYFCGQSPKWGTCRWLAASRIALSPRLS